MLRIARSAAPMGNTVLRPLRIGTRSFSDFDMFFGVHKGQKVSQIPLNYLQWLSGSKYMQRFSPDQQAFIRARVSQNQGAQPQPQAQRTWGQPQGQPTWGQPQTQQTWGQPAAGAYSPSAFRDQNFQTSGTIASSPFVERKSFPAKSPIDLPTNAETDVRLVTGPQMSSAIKHHAANEPGCGLQELFLSAWDEADTDDLVKMITRDGQTLQTVSLTPQAWTPSALAVAQAFVDSGACPKVLALKLGNDAEGIVKLGHILRSLPSDVGTLTIYADSRDSINNLMFEISHTSDPPLRLKVEKMVFIGDADTSSLEEGPGKGLIRGTPVKLTTYAPEEEIKTSVTVLAVGKERSAFFKKSG